ncbi:hypothetical protein BJX99DRAFT_234128 [Aspergillus californicus]
MHGWPALYSVSVIAWPNISNSPWCGNDTLNRRKTTFYDLDVVVRSMRESLTRGFSFVAERTNHDGWLLTMHGSRFHLVYAQSHRLVAPINPVDCYSA